MQNITELPQKKIPILLVILIIGVAFTIRIYQLSQQKILFSSDEFYWIQTARILPYIREGKLASPYWHEHMGFTNFNGAKWVYAIGLAMFGRTDFESIGTPPETYYKWNVFDGSPFPTDHELYPLLKQARLISAFIASLAVGLLFILSYSISKNILVSICSAILFFIHPISYSISVHALADSTFIVGELCIYMLLFRYLIPKKTHTRMSHYFLTGICLGFAMSTKINGYMFVPVVLGIIVYKNIIKNISNVETVNAVFMVCIGMCISFICLNPNLIFYRSYSLSMMLEDRINITLIHMNYFRIHDPSHVLESIPNRFTSLIRHVFSIPIVIGILASSSGLLYIQYRKQVLATIYSLLFHILYISAICMFYVVFDDERYFLPLLPFVCILASVWLISLSDIRMYRTKLKRLS